ncbi:methyltransferase, partial [Streptomyces varsoviensis]
MTTATKRSARSAQCEEDLDGLWTLPGVYAPQADTRLLARALRGESLTAGMEVLDIGTGSGALAVLAARLGARVAAMDVSRRAVLTARINALRAGRPARARVRVRRGDLSQPWDGRTFDMLLSNPPYVPAPFDEPPARGPARSWEGGRNGRRLVDALTARAPAALRPGGVLLMVHSGLCGV